MLLVMVPDKKMMLEFCPKESCVSSKRRMQQADVGVV